MKSVTSGCSACVLAYGQSATGKTHTMMGTEADPGLIPRLCAALAEIRPFELSVSFLEIYNERVHDLLGEVVQTCHSLPRRRGNARKDLRVREHPDRGPYVQNLRRVSVQDVTALLSLVNEGTRRRRTAATRRNSTSSRSHALLELATPTATLHLADLAGSEKASWEGCGGGRQKEGANINKSLVALSNVISALVNAGNGRGRFIPYRDSALTWLLKDCFTGGGNTFIIATVSPSVACYGESASTLRWAARARQLPPPKLVSPSSTIISKSVLQAQFNQLLAELSKNFIRYVPETGKLFYDDEHWKLHIIRDNNLTVIDKETAKIGNIMELLHPKADVQSESTASSVASGSSDVINTMDKNAEIANEISKEVDKLFIPVLERTNSGSDLKVIAPLRNKRRQYKSQEVLPNDERQPTNRSLSFTSALPSQSEDHINTKSSNPFRPASIPILYDRQRAEIVASVTERLYSKLKKKEEAAVAKMESVVDKKIMEPLSELRICTNARQRLMELSHRVARNRRRIGIPAHTQTRKFVTRVKDQAIDIQADLEAYVYRNRHFYALQRDAATETVSITPRCKEKAVGSNYGCLDLSDKSTITDTKQAKLKDSFIMTDLLLTRDCSTQTLIVPPPRRKKRMSSLSKYLKNIEKKNYFAEDALIPVININISQPCATDRDSHSSDENTERPSSNINERQKSMMTPDLLTNHSGVESSDVMVDEVASNDTVDKDGCTENIKIRYDKPDMPSTSRPNEDFPDSEEYSLPRVTVCSSRKTDHEEIKDMILGRNDNNYPYNIVLSPPRDRDLYKRTVKFKDEETSMSVASQTSWDWERKSAATCKCSLSLDSITDSEKDFKNPETESTDDSSGSSKMETTSFIWKNIKGENKNQCHTSRPYIPVYKYNSKYKAAKTKFYKEFLGLETNEDDILHSANKTSSSDSVESDVYRYKFRQRRKYFEDTFKFDKPINDFEKLERDILDTCDDLEISVNQYDNYLSNLQKNCRRSREEIQTRTPTEYLQHLMQLRREVVKADNDSDTFRQ
ncbi:kinesin-like protein K39 [Amyelois transitella]|uniref:kinesin-like protein K39 n=1 Tax=Amyelois transitella TaxID=680683 RepID=UPI0029906AA4|nr:kinesin-like protein K39 [Amyelois transitella]